MTPITIKQALDRDGDFHYLELWQGQNCIKLSFELPGSQTYSQTYKWAELKRQIDKIAQSISPYETSEQIGVDTVVGRVTGNTLKEWSRVGDES